MASDLTSRHRLRGVPADHSFLLPADSPSLLHLPRLSNGRTSTTPCERYSELRQCRAPTTSGRPHTIIGDSVLYRPGLALGVSPRIVGTPSWFLSFPAL